MTSQAVTVKTWIVPIALWTFPPLVGLIAGLLTDAGRDIAPEFFIACAGIAPVLGLALFIELAIVIGAVISEQDRTPANVATGRVLARATAGLMIVSGGCALLAVACERESTFLATTIVVAFLVEVYLLLETTYLRMGVNRISFG